jgi:hypothetical protein
MKPMLSYNLLLRRVPGIDIIFGGHDHIPSIDWEGTTPILKVNIKRTIILTFFKCTGWTKCTISWKS